MRNTSMGNMGGMSGMMSEESGASDNTMSLNPNDPQWKDVMDGWQDGQEYTLKNVRVRQDSPGQFVVLSAEAESVEPDAESEAEPAEGGESESAGYSNPAVSKLMGA